MITKTIRCPSCKTEITITGNPNEKIDITYSNCNLKGFYRFPSEQSNKKINQQSYVIEVKGLNNMFKDL